MCEQRHISALFLFKVEFLPASVWTQHFLKCTKKKNGDMATVSEGSSFRQEVLRVGLVGVLLRWRTSLQPKTTSVSAPLALK